MTSFAKSSLVLAIGLSTACSAGVTVNADWAPDTNFSNFHTYSWLPDAQSDGSGVANAITDERIKLAVDSNLAGKGFRKVSGNPDLMIGYQITTKENVSYQTVGNAWGGMGWGWGGGWGMGSSTTTAYHTTVGTLVMSIFQTEGKKMVWHGSGSTDLATSVNPDERQEMIDSAVRKILKDFPPPSGS